MKMPTDICRACGNQALYLQSGAVLDLEVNYFECPNCGYVQTETPYWLVRAYAEAIQRIKTDRESTIKIFAKRMRLEDLETLNSTYDYFAPRFSFPPRVSLEGVREIIKFYAEQNTDFKNRTPDEFVDHSILDELEKEGFFKKLGS